MRRTLLSFLFVMFASAAWAQTTTPTTLNFKLYATPCQNTVPAPRAYCLGYLADVDANGNLILPGDGADEWAIYVASVNPDGSFGPGSFLSVYADWDNPDATAAEQMITFASTGVSGIETNGGRYGGTLNGTFSGTYSSGDHTQQGTFTGTFTNLTFGLVKAGGYRGSTYWRRAIVSGSISITATPN